MKKKYIFDIECYPTFFSASFKLLSKKQEVWREFIIFYDTEGTNHINQLEELVEFINNEVELLIGYNNNSYDNPIINHLRSPRILREFSGRHVSTKDITANIKELSDIIINTEQNLQGEYISNLRKFKPYRSMDLFLLFNTIERKSLKQISINLKHHLIQDLPYDINHIVKYNEINSIMIYNKNDVVITEKLLYALNKEITDREAIYEKEKLDVRNDNSVNIGKRILRKYYEQESGKTYDQYKDGRSFTKEIRLNECVSSKIKFKTQEYRDLLYKIRSKVIDPTRRKKDKKKKNQLPDFEFIVKSKEMTHTIAKGGIHSNNPACLIEEDINYKLKDYDVASYYPFIIINEGYFPYHLGKEWLEGYKLVVKERIDAKKSGNTTKAEMLKISANGAYGLTKSEHSWMYDPKMTLSVCINGELYLLMLIEAIELYTTCTVIYSNTDGLTIKVPIGQEEALERVTKSWESYTGFTLEETRYKRMILKDVNNYIIEYYKKQDDGSYKISLKQKGEFLTGIKLNTGYDCPVVAIALEKYFINNTPVEDTIRNHKDIYDFMRAEKSSAKFKMIFQTVEQLREDEYTILQKNNRWIVTKGNNLEGKLFKVEFNSEDDEEENIQEELFTIDFNPKLIIKKSELESGKLTTIVNSVDESKAISTYKLDYNYYIKRCKDIIMKIESGKSVKTELMLLV